MTIPTTKNPFGMLDDDPLAGAAGVIPDQIDADVLPDINIDAGVLADGNSGSAGLVKSAQGVGAVYLGSSGLAPTGNLTITYTIDPTLAALQSTNASVYNALISAANTADQYFMTTYTTSTPVTLTYNFKVNTSGVASSGSTPYTTDYATFRAGVQATDNAATANADHEGGRR